MADIIDKSTRSRLMAGIRARNTKPEIVVRRGLHLHGFRFRLHRRDLPGCPDIVLPRYKMAVFVHGCFWHRHTTCRLAYTPKTRRVFWRRKFSANVKRDVVVKRELSKLGWRTTVIWECETRNLARLDRRLAQLSKRLGTRTASISRDLASHKRK